MKKFKLMVYYLLQFHWREVLLMVVLITGSVGAIFQSIWIWVLSLVIVLIAEIREQYKRDKDGII